MSLSLKRNILVAFFMLFPLACFSQDAATKDNPLKQRSVEDYKEDCSGIWCVKSIAVQKDGVAIDFDRNHPGSQVVYMIEEDGNTTHLERSETYSLPIGKKIGWGDGDHAFASMSLDGIIGNTALVAVSDEHRPPATHRNLAYTKTRKCKIESKYSSATK